MQLFEALRIDFRNAYDCVPEIFLGKFHIFGCLNLYTMLQYLSVTHKCPQYKDIQKQVFSGSGQCVDSSEEEPLK